MPIEPIIKLATVIVVGIMLAHPLTWKTELYKLENSMMKNISNTRSWGNPDIFQYAPKATQTGRAHNEKK